jgi:hypothetical protein
MNLFKDMSANSAECTISEELGNEALARLFQGEVLKHFAVYDQLLGQINATLQNQVLLLQIDKNIEKLKASSY